MHHSGHFVLYHIWLFRKRHTLITLIQLIGPILIIVLFTYNSHFLYTKWQIDTKNGNTIFSRLPEKDLYQSVRNCDEDNYVTYYSPKADIKSSDALIARMKSTYFSRNATKLEFVRVEQEADMIRFAVLYHAAKREDCYIGGIVFENIPWKADPNLSARKIDLSHLRVNSPKNPTKQFRITIRMASYMPDELESVLTHTLYYDPEYPRDYIPFLGLQLAVTRTFIQMTVDQLGGKWTSEEALNIFKSNINVEPFKFDNIYRHQTKSSEVQPLYVIVAISIVFSQTFMAMSLVRGPASDKETGFRVYLRSMGLRRAVYWISWFINELFIRLIVSMLQVALLFSDLSRDNVGLVQKGNFVIWYIFLVCHNLASISFFLFVASFCKRAIIAPYVAVTVWLLSYYFGDLFLTTSYFYTQYRIHKYLMCLNPNSALILGCSTMTRITGGIQWENINKRPDENELLIWEVWVFLLLDTVIYYVLTLYGDQLRPSQYGVKFWQHCCSTVRSHAAIFLRKRSRGIRRIFDATVSEMTLSEDTVPDISFIDVTQTFGKNTVLKNVNVHVMERKRTAIVGPTGAGKTTITKLICGSFLPSSGQVYVGGQNMSTARTAAATQVSLCPDNDLLCTYLTVGEHLQLIGLLRGSTLTRSSRKAKEILKALELKEVSKEFPDDLVSIQRRKLCIALSLVGKSKIIVFDNPTDGMDHQTRIQIWKFVKVYCQHHTLLLLTSSLPEAYYFADRIALLTNQRILGSATKEQLEAGLKIGYHLKLSLTPDAEQWAVDAFVRNNLPGAVQLEKHSARFQSAFEAIENKLETKTSIGKKSLASIKSTPSIKSGGSPGRLRTDGSGADIFYDALSKVTSVPEGDFPDYDYYELDTSPEVSKNVLFMFLPTSQLERFCSFFELLENAEVRRKEGILVYKLIPYTIDIAYYELEQYMRLNDSKESFHMEEDVERQIDINRKCLEEDLTARTRCISLQRFFSQICKRVAFHYSVWLHIVFQCLVPLILFLVVIRATEKSFRSQMEGARIVDEDWRRFFVSPTILLTDTVPERENRLSLHFKTQVPPARLESVESIHTRMHSLGSYAETLLAAKYVAGVTFERNETTVLFSPIAFHAGPIALSILLNSLVELTCPVGYSVRVQAHPIQSSKSELLRFYEEEPLKFDADPATSFAVIFALGFFCFTSFMIVQPLTERHLLLKRLQTNTGLSRFIYWLGLFLMDSIPMLLFAGMVVCVLHHVPTHVAFRSSTFGLNCFIFFVVAGLSSLGNSYCLSFSFMQPKSCYFACVSYNQVAGLFLYIFATFFDGLPGFIIRCMSRLLQPYNVVVGIFHLTSLGIHNARCDLINSEIKVAVCDPVFQQKYGFQGFKIDHSCCFYFETGVWEYTKPYWTRDYRDYATRDYYDSFMFDILVLCLHILLSILYIGCRETGWRPKYLWEDEDDDKGQAEQVSASSSEVKGNKSLSTVNSHSFHVCSVSKRFFLESDVLTNVSFMARPGDLISIVGPARSAKSVLLSILAGFDTESTGTIFFGILKKSKLGKRMNYLRYTGYVPADDIFKDIPHMKGLTLLKLFGRLRGIPESDLGRHVRKWCILLGLRKKLHRRLEYYSNPIRQKLKLAMAFIGEPALLIMDEPLASLDPFSKRQFWAIADHLRRKLGRIFILATSNVKEIESRSTRIIFLVNGSIVCDMQPEAMTRKYAGGFILLLKLKEGTSFNDWTTVKNMIAARFPKSLLQNEQTNSLEYRIDPVSESETLTLSKMFRTCQEIFEEQKSVIEDYTLSEETIVHVYNSFAQHQQPYNKHGQAREEFYMHYC